MSDDQLQRMHLRCRDKALPWGERTLVMGILNVTPDSFSDGGKYVELDSAIAQAERMIEQGADLIDIGGESTRPGATYVEVEEEIRRVIPIVEALKQRVTCPLSVDTYKPEVAEAALDAGADLINDIWGLRYDERMAEVVARYDCPIILMHNRQQADYHHMIQEVCDDLLGSVAIARRYGIADENLWLDPGFGFGKTLRDNLYLMNHLRSLTELGFPVVLGTSRKSMIWRTLNEQPDRVVAATMATLALGVAQGCGIVRVHDVEQARQAVAMTDAIISMQLRGEDIHG